MKFFTLFLLLPLFTIAQAPVVRLNQVGFYPQEQKRAVVNGEATDFYLLTGAANDTVFRGYSTTIRTSAYSGKRNTILDFSAFKTPGRYRLYVPGRGYSNPFDIRGQVHRSLLKAVIKGYYYQRCSVPLEPVFAGRWNRAAGHPDTAVLIHPAAATARRPAGTRIKAPGGWYDAGDYNKYIVNSGVTMGTLLSAYEEYPAFFDTLYTDIPESGNALPDLLDEVLWNLRWMLAMQAPDDGGVYHKLTTASFEGMVMPVAAIHQRYVVEKTTTATLDFAAVMAQAARVLRAKLPGLSDSCLQAAQKAWSWAQAYPAMIYDQEAMNMQFKPAVTTGTYGDRQPADEHFWAAAELLATTGDSVYISAVRKGYQLSLRLPSWGYVAAMGYFTLARCRYHLPAAIQKDTPLIFQKIIQQADGLLQGPDRLAYGTVMGHKLRDFTWGSNSVAANQGMLLLEAFRLQPNAAYREGALSNLDYLLGRNATGYCFVTGAGTYAPLHPHHRPSEADDIMAPVPGLLVGGPNPGRQDHCVHYPATSPDEAYLDAVCSYASNEVAINWNAPLVYCIAALEALQASL